MKLYLSGAIATEPDFVNIFQNHQDWLESHGYEVVNPTRIIKCRDDRDQYVNLPACQDHENDDGTESQDKVQGLYHTWECCLKYDLIAMLQCDGVAMINNHLQSKGAMLEGYISMQVGLPIKSIREWISISVREQMKILQA